MEGTGMIIDSTIDITELLLHGLDKNPFPDITDILRREAAAEIKRLREETLNRKNCIANQQAEIERLRVQYVELSDAHQATRQKGEAEIERLHNALATVMGDAEHGQNMNWEERCCIARAALASISSNDRLRAELASVRRDRDACGEEIEALRASKCNHCGAPLDGKW